MDMPCIVNAIGMRRSDAANLARLDSHEMLLHYTHSKWYPKNA
jgi:hypothetical protein